MSIANTTGIIYVVGAILSQNGVTLFTTDGVSKVYQQGDWKIQEIVQATLIPLATNPGQPVALDLSKYSVKGLIEKASGGEVKVETVEGSDEIAAVTIGGSRIENAGKLETHLKRAAYGENFTGFKLFMESFAEISHNHTAQELLDFMEKGDLPIADDGSILVYKFLDAQGGAGNEGYYVDKHTRKVRQRLGSLVKMPLKDIDSRRTECSTGLHVCSNRYGSYGNTAFIAKVRARDVVAVPSQENGKMRVASYHLVEKLPSATYKALTSRSENGVRGSAMSTEEGRTILANVIAGNHIGIVETVTVGGSTVVNPNAAILVKKKKGQVKRADPKAKVKPVVEVPDEKKKATYVSPAKVRQDVKKATRESLVKAATDGDFSAAMTAVATEMQKPERKTPLLAWELAKIGDFVTIKGSSWVSDGDHQVIEVDEVNRNSARLKVKDSRGVGRWIANPLIKAIAENVTPASSKKAAYEERVEKAKAMLKDGKSLRVVEAELGICRKKLAKRLKNEGFSY
jgi:hypothetical protein